MIEDLPLLAYLARGVEGDGGVMVHNLWTNFIKFYRRATTHAARRPRARASRCDLVSARSPRARLGSSASYEYLQMLHWTVDCS